MIDTDNSDSFHYSSIHLFQGNIIFFYCIHKQLHQKGKSQKMYQVLKDEMMLLIVYKFEYLMRWSENICFMHMAFCLWQST